MFTEWLVVFSDVHRVVSGASPWCLWCPLSLVSLVSLVSPLPGVSGVPSPWCLWCPLPGVSGVSGVCNPKEAKYWTFKATLLRRTVCWLCSGSQLIWPWDPHFPWSFMSRPIFIQTKQIYFSKYPTYTMSWRFFYLNNQTFSYRAL